MYRGSEEHKDWIFDLYHENLASSEAIIRGFLKFYVLSDLGIIDVQQDLRYRTIASKEKQGCHDFTARCYK